MIRWLSRSASKRLTLGLAAAALTLGLLAGAPAQQEVTPDRINRPKRPTDQPKPPAPPVRPASPMAVTTTAGAVNELIQTFPTNDVMQTAWKVHWATQRGNGIYLQDAWFKRSPSDPWMQVVGDCRLSEAFVPYHSGSPRFWDV